MGTPYALDAIAPAAIGNGSSVLVLALAVGLILPIYGLWVLLRRLYFHPLSGIPGPFLATLSNFPYCRSFMGGRQPYDRLKLHEKYGPVVRVAPEELSFSSAQSWKDIYGQRAGHLPFVKSSFYDGGNFANQAHSIVSERDPANHREMRKYLSMAFSERSLKEQEYLISGVIDQFVDQIGKLGGAGIDLNMWFNLMTFDVIGELAFGESFGGVASGKMHFWIAVVLASMGQGSLSDTLSRFPLLGRVYTKLNPGWLRGLVEGSTKHESYTLELVKKRISQETDRKDFMTSLLDPSNREKYNIADIQLAAHASDFVIAGSETTATTLATITWYLFRHPKILAKLQHEVRSSFKEYRDINAQSTSNLPYLHAVCLEALRIFPPLPLGLPRVVPAGGDTIDGCFIPGGVIVSTNPYAASMSSANFQDPEKFDPERWLAMNDIDVLEASQPFSVGTRSCLGRSLGWMELHTALAKVHFSYDLELLNPEVDWQRESKMQILWEKPPLMVKVIPRHRT